MPAWEPTASSPATTCEGDSWCARLKASVAPLGPPPCHKLNVVCRVLRHLLGGARDAGSRGRRPSRPLVSDTGASCTTLQRNKQLPAATSPLQHPAVTSNMGTFNVAEPRHSSPQATSLTSRRAKSVDRREAHNQTPWSCAHRRRFSKPGHQLLAGCVCVCVCLCASCVVVAILRGESANHCLAEDAPPLAKRRESAPCRTLSSPGAWR